MKILKVLHGFPPETGGGTERAVAALGRSMRDAGHEVVILAGSLVSGSPDRVGHEQYDGLRVVRMHRDDLYFESWFKSYAPGVSAAVASILAEERPDVVHVHHWLRLTSDIVRQARAAGVTTAVTLHDYFSVLATPVRMAGQDRAEPPPASPGYVSGAEVSEAFEFHRRDFRAEVCAAHVRCAPSRSHADGLQALAAGSLGPIEITPPPLLEVPPRRSAGVGPRGRRLVVWGSLYEEKGLEVVLAALRQSPGWSLEVWGEAHEPGYRQRIQDATAKLPVTFRGAFEAVDLAAIDADYAVLSSRCYESYGLTMDEALCLGLPVLASDLPPYRERGPADSCAFFAPGDADGLAALLADEAGLDRLATPDPPDVLDASAAAADLLELYARARRGDIPAAPHVDPVADSERAALLFRRAERRLWTALQQNDPPAPPDAFP